MSLIGNTARKPIRISVKREVYLRAEGRCEKCRIEIPWGDSRGRFHHNRDPSVSPTAKTVEFLCSECHAKYGHNVKNRILASDLRSLKQTTVKRNKVSRRVSGLIQKERPKRAAIRSTSGNVIAYRTIRPRKKIQPHTR